MKKKNSRRELKKSNSLQKKENLENKKENKVWWRSEEDKKLMWHWT